MAFYTESELENLGFGYIGKGVKISKNVSFYNIHNIYIDDFSRIDDFCVISAGRKISIGRNVHIAVFCSLIGNEEIVLRDYSGLSSRVSIYSSSDDYSGDFMTNPTIPLEYSNVISGKVELEEHVIVGAGSVILPMTSIKIGCAVGALSLCKGNYEKFGVYVGTPAKRINQRSQKLLEVEQDFKLRYFT